VVRETIVPVTDQKRTWIEGRILDKLSLDSDVAQILARLDRSSPDALLNSIAEQLLRLHQALNRVAAKMHALEITQATYDQMVASAETVSLAAMPRVAVVDASFSLSREAGFYQLEYDSQGVPYRWTGPEPTFLFELFVDRKAPATIRMRFSKSSFDAARHKVGCYVDGHEVATVRVEIDGEFEVRGMLPPRELVGGTVVSFVCPSVSAPDGHQDIRLLGLVFRWLRIEEAPIPLPGREETENLADLPVESRRTSQSKLRRRIRSVGDAS
jgi:hypothetical protein